MTKRILIDAQYPNEIRTVLLNKNNLIEEIEYQTADKAQIKGNIYLAKVSRIEPSLQAAFITYDSGKSGFLPFSEIHPDFFNITETRPAINLKEITVPEMTSQDLTEKEEILKAVDDERPLDLKDVSTKELSPIKVDFDCVEDEIEDVKVQYENLYKKYKIQDVIKRGQILLVQAQKEERGNKAASFTTFLSLAGKFCVLMANTPKQNGISRRISNQEERKRLKEIVAAIVPEAEAETSSLIIRTAGIGRTNYEIKKDYEYLARTWNKIRNAAIKMTPPSTVHVEEEIIPKTIRDMLDDKVSEVIIQGHQQYLQAIEFIKQILPNEVSKIVHHTSLEPIFTSFNVEDQILNLYQPVVSLPSGGYIVINPTEALTSIDVNSGKSTNEKHIEETALKTNLEAAFHIAKQMNLRDISGLIVVDFIDMDEAKNRKILEHAFKEALSSDKAKIQINQISNLGLVELSRQRLKPSFLEKHSAACKYCSGKGVVRSSQANSLLILRTIEQELSAGSLNVLNVFAHIDSVLYILNKKRKDIERIEQDFAVEINLYEDKQATAESFYIEKIKLQTAKKKESSDNKLEQKNKNSETKNAEALPQKSERQAQSKALESPKPSLAKQPASKQDSVRPNSAKQAANKQETIKQPALVIEEDKLVPKIQGELAQVDFKKEDTGFEQIKQKEIAQKEGAQEDNVQEQGVEGADSQGLKVASHKKRRSFQRKRKFVSKSAKPEMSNNSDQ